MSENEIQPEAEEVEGEAVEVEAEETASKPESKPKLTPEQRRGILLRQLTKLNKELGIAEENKPEVLKKEDKKDFDYAEKAFLKASGIHSNEYAFVHEVMQGTGKSLEEVLEAKYFQAELKERRDAETTKAAVPSGTKRTSSNAKNDVDYWISKGELPTDDIELRSKVVNEKIRRAKISQSKR